LERVSAFNMLTATAISRVPMQRIGLLLSKSPDWLARLFGERALTLQFKELNFLHTARWVNVGRFPRVTADQPRERRSPRWMLFCANFNGDWDAYFGAFMEGMGEGVYDLWGQCVGYPGFPAADTAYELIAWLRGRAPISQHFYAAYPQATTDDVRSALRVHREVSSVALDLRARPVTGESSRHVEETFDALAVRIQHCLGEIGPPPDAPPPPTLPDGTIRGVVTLFPVLPGDEQALMAAIEALPAGTDSPFRRVAGTHFARLAVLCRDEAGRHPRETIELRNSYLLFAADFDESGSSRGAEQRFFEAVYRVITDDVRSVWAHCWGFDAVEDARQFGVLARRCRCKVLREFVDYPDASLRSVLTALVSQRRLVPLVGSRRRGGPVTAEEILSFLDERAAG
jgi:hypothetical protein